MEGDKKKEEPSRLKFIYIYFNLCFIDEEISIHSLISAYRKLPSKRERYRLFAQVLFRKFF